MAGVPTFVRSVRARVELVETRVENAAARSILDNHLDFARWPLEPNGDDLEAGQMR